MRHEIILEDKVYGEDKEDYYFKSKILERKSEKIKKIENNKKLKDGLSEEIEKDIKEYMNHIKSKEKHDLSQIQKVSGIFTKFENFEKYIKTLIPGSFGLWYEFELESPYFSSDVDELYMIQNPILKEQISKVPMIRGSSWKGLLSSTALDRLRKRVECQDCSIDKLISCYLSLVRVFGAGSEDFRKVEEEIKKIDKEAKKDKYAAKLTEELFKYCVFDLGININIKKNGTSVNKQLIDQIFNDMDKTNNIFSVRKGRAIFYPTYFNRLNYEVINPHNREKEQVRIQ